jgi:hypothetical protein
MRGALLLGILALGACDPGGDAPPPASGQPATPVQSAADAFHSRPVEPAVERRTTLFADGVLPPVTAAKALRFGEDRRAVLAALEPVLGKPVTSRNEECGAGPMDFAAFGALTLNFIDDTFVGWHAREGARVVTADGVTLGTTLAAIRAERSAALVSGSTLEGEFEYATAAGGTIGGFLEGEGDAARAIGLYAGVNCFFR